MTKTHTLVVTGPGSLEEPASALSRVKGYRAEPLGKWRDRGDGVFQQKILLLSNKGWNQLLDVIYDHGYETVESQDYQY